MQDQLMQPLSEILRATTALLAVTELSDTQEIFVQSTYQASQTMRDLVVSFPLLQQPRSIEVFSYEARSYLSSIIGYAELLLDEDDGTMTLEQQEYIHQIRVAGKQMVRLLPGIADGILE